MKLFLRELDERFAAEVRVLRALAPDHPTVGIHPPEHHALAEYCIIQLHDSWNRFVRDLVLYSASGNAISSSERSIVPSRQYGALNQEDAMSLIRGKWSPPRAKPSYWEPSWFDFKQMDRALTILDPSNRADIASAVGARNNPAESLRALRNFCAHRGISSSRKLLADSTSWAPLGWRNPLELAFRTYPRGLSSPFHDWCDGFELVARAAT